MTVVNARTILLGLLVTVCTSVTLAKFQHNNNNTSWHGHFIIHGSKHTVTSWFGFRFTHCNGTKLISGINQNTDNWVNCFNIGSKGDETYISAVWRVYTCVLGKYRDDEAETISFLEFSEIITASYPEEIKKSITDLTKSLAETQGKENPWLTSKIKFTDYSSIDKIRAQYYDIEKGYCENGTEFMAENAMSEKSWDTCSPREEIFHRGSACCVNNTIPFLPRSGGSPFSFFNDTHCEETLHSTLNKFYGTETKKQIILNSCKFSCYMVEKSYMTIDEVQAVTGSDEGQLRQIVNATYPYIPVQMQETLTEKMVAKYNETIASQYLEAYVKHLNVIDLTESETAALRSCLVIQYFQAIIPLHNLACPRYISDTNGTMYLLT